MAFSYVAVMSLIGSLTGGTITASALETLLAGASYRSAWQFIASNRFFIRSLTVSSTAMAIVAGSATANADLIAAPEGKRAIFQSGLAIKAIIDDTAVGFPAWEPVFNFAVNNTPGLIKLKRQVFTASGTWSYPDHVPPGGLLAVASVAVGAGGGSAAATSGGASGGGGGGAIVAAAVTPGSLTGDVTVTIGAGSTGSAGGSSSFGAFNTASGGSPGVGGAGDGAGGAGGGSASAGDWSDADILTACWQRAANVKGGAGGAGFYNGSAGPGVSGGDAISANTLTLGTGGVDGNTTSKGGAHGGGGAGGSEYGAVTAAAANSGGGAGGTANNFGAPGSSGSGLVILHWIEP